VRILLLAAVAALAHAEGDPPEITGAWRIVGTDESFAARSAVLYIERKDGLLGGRWNTARTAVDLHDVLYTDGRLSCWWFVDTEGSRIRLSFSGTVVDGELHGELRSPGIVTVVRGRPIPIRSGTPPDTPPAPANEPPAPVPNGERQAD
jgi:hypothetical protein